MANVYVSQSELFFRDDDYNNFWMRVDVEIQTNLVFCYGVSLGLQNWLSLSMSCFEREN